MQSAKDYLYLILAGIEEAGFQVYSEVLPIGDKDLMTGFHRRESGLRRNITPNSITINAIKEPRGNRELKSGRYTIYRFLREHKYPDLKTDFDGQCLVITSEKHKLYD